MFQFMRSKFGPIAVAIIIGFIAFVFVFFGVYSPRTREMGRSGSYAALVNGDPISAQEFAQSYEQRIQYFEGMMKGKVDPAMVRQFVSKRSVLNDLVQRKALQQEAKKLNFVVSDQELAVKIRQMPYFQKDGRFDKGLYERILQANNFVASRFEDKLRQDLMTERLVDFMRGRVLVSDAEVAQEFQSTADQRQVDFVVLSVGMGMPPFQP